MDSLKDRKVLPIHQKKDAAGKGGMSWEEEYFSRLSKAAMPHTDEGNFEEPRRQVSEIPIDAISTSPFQTREQPSEHELEELRNSILSRGVIQPIIVRERAVLDEDRTPYELVAGERRLRACRLAGLDRVPAIVEDFTDQESLEVSIIENAQRENLNPIEESRAYAMLSERFSMSHAEIAKVVGKNRATISNSLRLLQLAPEVIELLRSGELTAGHGRALLMVDDATQQLELARLAVRKALSVRALESLVSQLDEPTAAEEPDEEISREEQALRRMEQKIGGFLGIERVRLSTDPEGRKRISLAFDTEAAWKRFMSKIRD